jgi:hypothetical protein
MKLAIAIAYISGGLIVLLAAIGLIYGLVSIVEVIIN